MEADIRTGARLGRYRLQSTIGAGGMGTVYLARHEVLGCLRVVKVLRREFVGDPAEVERFVLEARAAASLCHPNIVQIVDVDVAEGRPYFVMEHLEGEDLRVRARREGRLPWPQVRDIALQVCAAMQFAHERGVIHRDLKPANLFCARGPGGETIKVLDFGIAKMLGPALAPDEALTRPGVALGTPAYMSPEQLLGGVVSPCSDVYALGVVLFQLLTGHLPGGGGGVAPGLEVPDRLERCIGRAWELDPSRRFASMAAFADELGALRSFESQRTSLQARRVRRRSAPLVLAIGAAGLVGGLGLVSAEPWAAAEVAAPEIGAVAAVTVTEALPVAALPVAPGAGGEGEVGAAAGRERDRLTAAAACETALDARFEAFTRGPLERCGRRAQAMPRESLEVRVGVGAGGRVSRVGLRPTYYEDDPFGDCVRAALLAERLPACAAARTLTRRLVYRKAGR